MFNFSRSKPNRRGKQDASIQCSDTLLSERSTSINLEDLIEDYDGCSKRSFSSSLANVSKVVSQTYFTANKNGDSSSFYSALQDGFSLGDYEVPADPILQTNSPLLWASDVDQKVRNSMMAPSSFEVFWHDLFYRIEPKMTLFSLWNDLEQRFRGHVMSLLDFTRRGRTGNFNPSDEKSLNKNEPITIIQQISGSFKSGELTAIMGPSGAGKTSLLNFLSRRREDGYSGELYVNTSSNRRFKISTIPQSDHLPEYLTVRENLIFASRLKNTHYANQDHEENVERVANLLGLDDCLDTRSKKISGGQHKRVAIAQELLSRPDILILDEPTSGLDSLTCYKTLSVLKDLVKASADGLIDPIAIVLTIHQPQQEVFDIFDKIYVMSNGGLAIYDGPPDGCTSFIEKHSNIQLPEVDHNPASFMIEIASCEYGIEPIEALDRQVKKEFAETKIRQRLQKSISSSALVYDKLKENSSKGLKNKIDENICTITKPNGGRSKPTLFIDPRIAKGSSMNKGDFWLKTRILTERLWISIIRDPKQLIGRIIFHIILPIILALMMGTEPGRSNACPKFVAEYHLKDLVEKESPTSKDVQEELFLSLENLAAIFILMYALTSANIAATTLSFTLDMQSSLKEFYNGWYSMYSYIFARIISEIPLEICFPIITLAIGYPLTGQMTGHGISDAYRILLTALAIILGSMIGQTMGMIFGAIYMGHVSTALFASQGATLPLVFISGFVVRTKNMSKFVYALSKFSFYKHTLELAMIARYGFNVCDCKPEMITGQDAKLVGIPERFNSFTKYWMNAFTDVKDEDLKLQTNVTTTDDNDIFQMFAKQISLYNTYGMEVKSCADVKPFQLYDLSLSESDIPNALLALITILMIMKLLLFITVKLVVYLRTSL